MSVQWWAQSWILLFQKYIYRLYETLKFPKDTYCFKCSSLAAFCILLKHYACPHYLDIVPCFGLSVPQMIMICNKTLSFIYNNWGICCIHSTKIGCPLQIVKVLLMLFKNKGPLKQLLGVFKWQSEKGLQKRHKLVNFVYNGHKKLRGIKF